MKYMGTKILSALSVLSGLLMISSCMDDFKMELPEVDPSGKVTVGFFAGGTQTRTAMLPNGLSTEWVSGDEIAVWAMNSSGSYALTNQTFRTYGIDSSRGFFSSTLDAAMPEGTYTYYCCYPVPLSVSGTQVTFDVPAEQDGKAGNGADIMVATPVQHAALAAIPDPEDHSGMSMSMNRMMHQFRFWIPSSNTILNGEGLERIYLTFPSAVAGNVTVDVASPTTAPVLSGTDSHMILWPDGYLHMSTSDDNPQYSCLAFAPTSFDAGQSLVVKAYTDTKIAIFDPIDLQGRTFLPGHSTPVKLNVKELIDMGRFRFTVSANNLGENANSVTLTAPAGCVWGDTGSNVFTYAPGYEITAGETFEIIFEDIDAYRALSGQSITVSFDTEHVTTTETIVLPDMTTGSLTHISAALPYLLYEDFSTVPTFSSNDAYKTSSAGSMGAHSFLNGWTGGRIGAEATKCIRIACRRETSADYDARVDSAPILQLKKSAKISVTFDYGMNNQFGGISIITNPDVGQTFFVGYVTSTEGYKSGDTDGTFDSANQRYVFEKTGSYDSTPNTDTYYINNVPTGTVRITWRTEVQHQAGTNNTTCWLYIDNVKVQIAK